MTSYNFDWIGLITLPVSRHPRFLKTRLPFIANYEEFRYRGLMLTIGDALSLFLNDASESLLDATDFVVRLMRLRE